MDTNPQTQHSTDNSLTRLTQKQYSPLVIRKMTKWGFPIYIAMITDDSLDSLDRVVVDYMEHRIDQWKSDSIQDKRDMAGGLVERLCEAYPATEGAAVIFYTDKSFISSLHGDFMTHAACKIELFTLLQMSTGV